MFLLEPIFCKSKYINEGLVRDIAIELWRLVILYLRMTDKRHLFGFARDIYVVAYPAKLRKTITAFAPRESSGSAVCH